MAMPVAALQNKPKLAARHDLCTALGGVVLVCPYAVPLFEVLTSEHPIFGNALL